MTVDMTEKLKYCIINYLNEFRPFIHKTRCMCFMVPVKVKDAPY